MGARRTEGQPQDRLTRICDAMTDTLEAHPEYRDGDKAIVMLMNGDAGDGGLITYGYDADSEATADLFLHLKAMFEANGKTLIVIQGGAASPN